MSRSQFLSNRIVILDFGSQYTQLIARRVREAGVFSEILPHTAPLEIVTRNGTKGIIFSGGPASVFKRAAPKCDPGIFTAGIPILGICYGMQLMAHMLGGSVIRGDKREYGLTKIFFNRRSQLFNGLVMDAALTVWMSHWDQVIRMPEGFSAVAHSDNTDIVAMEDDKRQFYALQFHPEVMHTDSGRDILNNFVYTICNAEKTWSLQSYAEFSIENIRGVVGDSRVVCALSGGVDSSVTAILIHRAIGNKLKCVFVNNGVLRQGEPEKVVKIFKEKLELPLIYFDASSRFLRKLKGIKDPEKKRKIIGSEFISAFEYVIKKNNLSDVKFLAQGTLYPDVIESTSFRGPSAKIKSHHNVGGLPKRLKFKLIEPLRELFKDEVRVIGRHLGVPDEILKRHPFPGPGLAVRIIGEITKKRLEILKRADLIVEEELRMSGEYDKTWQGFVVLLPVKSVGVMGDKRSYSNVVALRCVNSVDGMTANWSKIPYDILARISTRIVNEVDDVNRVVYDITNKPPGTIEWE